MRRRVSRFGAVLGAAVVGAALAGCSVTTTGTPAVTAVNPLDPSPSSSSGGPANGERVDLQLRPVLDVTPATPTQCPDGAVPTPSGSQPASLCSQDRTLLYSLGPAVVDGDHVTSMEIAGSSLGPAVRIRLDAMGATALSNATLRGSQLQPPRSELAIVTHGRVQAAPAMTDQIEGGILDISGFDSPDAARQALTFIQSSS